MLASVGRFMTIKSLAFMPKLMLSPIGPRLDRDQNAWTTRQKRVQHLNIYAGRRWGIGHRGLGSRFHWTYAVLTAIFFSALCASVLLGKVTVRTPFLKLASILSVSTSAGT